MPDRRSLLTSAGLAAVAVGTGVGTAACGTPEAVGPNARPGKPAVTVPTKDIPVGGGTVLKDGKYVVTQPKAGEFRAFDKACTHQGCPVSAIEEGAIICRCHGARFSIEDGSVLTGPATRKLDAVSAKVEGDHVVVERTAAS